VRRLNQAQVGLRRQTQKTVKEVGREGDVVVGYDQPVECGDVVLGECQIDVVELPSIAQRRQRDGDIVPGAPQRGQHLLELGFSMRNVHAGDHDPLNRELLRLSREAAFCASQSQRNVEQGVRVMGSQPATSPGRPSRS